MDVITDFLRGNMKMVVIGGVATVLAMIVASVVVVYTSGIDGAFAVRDALPYIVVGSLGLGAIAAAVIWASRRLSGAGGGYDDYDEEDYD